MDWITRNAVKIIAAALAIVLLLGVLQVRSCQQARQQAVQGRLDRAQDSATVGSAQDAINTQGEVAGNAAASEQLTAQNREEIRNAKGADSAVDPALRDAGFASLCRRPAFRDSPSGRLRCPPATGVAQPR